MSSFRSGGEPERLAPPVIGYDAFLQVVKMVPWADQERALLASGLTREKAREILTNPSLYAGEHVDLRTMEMYSDAQWRRVTHVLSLARQVSVNDSQLAWFQDSLVRKGVSPLMNTVIHSDSSRNRPSSLAYKLLRECTGVVTLVGFNLVIPALEVFSWRSGFGEIVSQIRGKSSQVVLRNCTLPPRQLVSDLLETLRGGKASVDIESSCVYVEDIASAIATREVDAQGRPFGFHLFNAPEDWDPRAYDMGQLPHQADPEVIFRYM